MPQAAAVATLEKHVRDLVAQNQSTEKARQQAQADLDEVNEELKAARENLLLAKGQWKLEKFEWREGCNAVCHGVRLWSGVKLKELRPIP